MNYFKKAKWIWNTSQNKNAYLSFKCDFNLKDTKNVNIKLSCDSVYNLYVNGQLVGFFSCADYPYYKLVDIYQLDKYLKCGDNSVRIDVWYFGDNSQTYVVADAGLIFEIYRQDDVLAYSDKNTPSRIMNEYLNGDIKKITMQLGYSFEYDNNAVLSGYSCSEEIGKTCEFFERPIKHLQLSAREEPIITKTDFGYLIDLKKEVAGFIDLDFVSESKQKITFAYGEYLINGRVNRIIGDRDYSFYFIAKKGGNKYINAFRRIAGRYIEVIAEDRININYIGVRQVFYPLTVRKAKLKNELQQKIYDVSVNTLRLCMHEHYEDCPLREQALYVLDSRNQMLCGYYAFESTEYQRANLILISKGLRKDGLLSLCFPAGIDFPIPFFSLCYIMQVYEYIKHTNDKDILKELEPVLKTVMKTFTNRLDDSGLIPSFPYPFWNFYEWAESSSNENEITRKKEDKYIFHYDLIINCMYVYASKFYNELFDEKIDVERTRNAIKEKFFDKNRGLFCLSDNNSKASQLGQSMAILAGIKDRELADRIIKDKSLIGATLSMRAFVYDALLEFGEKYKDFIEKDIENRYDKMLKSGATSFWETEKGGADFGGAGSMCHGWSAIPVYYFNVLGNVKY